MLPGSPQNQMTEYHDVVAADARGHRPRSCARLYQSQKVLSSQAPRTNPPEGEP